MRFLLSSLTGVVLGLATVTASAAELMRVESPHSVSMTADNLVAAVENAGAKVFLRVDHQAGAESVGVALRPSTVVILGNPKLGSPLLQDAPGMGLDVPLRVLVMQDEDGGTVMVYHNPVSVAAVHGVPADHPVLAKMSGALAKLTGKAAE